MTRYALAFVFSLLAMMQFAAAQAPNVAQLQYQLQNVSDQLEAAQADRAASAALLDRFKAAVKELQQATQQLNQQVVSAKADAAKKDQEIAGVRAELAKAKAAKPKLEPRHDKPDGKPPAK